MFGRDLALAALLPALLFAWSASTHAQPPGGSLGVSPGVSGGEPLTLERALELALERNETPGIAEARIAQARAQVREAWSRLLPTALLQGTYTRRNIEVEREVGGQRAVIQSANALAANGTLETTLLDAPAIPFVLSAYDLEEASEYDAEDLVRALSFDVAVAFYGVLSAEELLAAAERRVEVAASAVDVARRRLDSGLANANEVTRSELSLSTARLAHTDAALLVRTTRLALGQLLAVPVEGPLVAPPPAPPVTSDIVGEIVRPDLLALEARLRATETLSIEPYLRIVPSLGVGASFRATNETGFAGQFATWNLYATATWVLYDGGLRYAQAAQRRAEAEELRLTLSNLRRAASTQEAEARARVEASAASREQAEVAARVARENADQVERLFAAGLATALERADAIASAYEAEAELARSTFALRLALLEVRRARGEWALEGLARPGEAR